MAKQIRTIGKVFSAEIEVYSECKYTASAEVFENSKRVRYDDIDCWEIVNGEDAKQIEEETDANSVDDHHEYLILHLVDGRTATFRNSYVDMFRVYER